MVAQRKFEGSNAAGGEPGGESETESSIAKRSRWQPVENGELAG